MVQPCSSLNASNAEEQLPFLHAPRFIYDIPLEHKITLELHLIYEFNAI